jgi:hypothetical protein
MGSDKAGIYALCLCAVKNIKFGVCLADLDTFNPTATNENKKPEKEATLFCNVYKTAILDELRDPYKSISRFQ